MALHFERMRLWTGHTQLDVFLKIDKESRHLIMKTKLLSLSCLFVSLAANLFAAEDSTSSESYLKQFEPKPAPQAQGLVLEKGDRLAICGDSITEQKMYSRIMETYLTVCVPDLNVSVRQYGWGGETASGFLARMTNDCLRFKPTIATTCYGMNDHRYGRYTEAIGKLYRDKQTAIVESFKNHGARVVLGSPGCVSHKDLPLNQNLCTLRNIDIEIAEGEKVGFADVFWPMLTAEVKAHEIYATNYWIAGGDGVHPGWAGHLVMAYAFLKGFGLDGNLGNVTVDLDSGKATAQGGHEVVSSKPGEIEIKSSRYPFCATGDMNLKSQNSVLSGMSLVPFNKDLNRFMLVASAGKAARYKVTWGTQSKSYSAAELQSGVNLANDFAINPFVDAFKKVDAAVGSKQNYETKQIKQIFHDLISGKNKSADDVKDAEMKKLFSYRSEDGKWDRDGLAAATEETRAPLVQKIKDAFVPVTHTIRIEAE
jgi:hypothetical protein